MDNTSKLAAETPVSSLTFGNAHQKKRLTMTPFNTSKKIERPLLNSRSFPLNGSCSKLVSVGLKPLSDSYFECCIQITSQTFHGICFSENTWSALKNEFGKISNYFNSSVNDFTNDKIKCGEIVLTLTTSFGEKSVVFDRQMLYDPPIISDDEEDSQLFPPPEKKVYTPAVVLQKKSFEGLVNVAPCIDSYLTNNKRMKEDISKLYDGVIEEVYKRFMSNKFMKRDVTHVNQYVKTKNSEIKEKVAAKSSDGFRENLFDSMYHELTYLYSYNVASNVCKKLYQDHERAKRDLKKHLIF